MKRKELISDIIGEWSRHKDNYELFHPSGVRYNFMKENASDVEGLEFLNFVSRKAALAVELTLNRNIRRNDVMDECKHEWKLIQHVDASLCFYCSKCLELKMIYEKYPV